MCVIYAIGCFCGKILSTADEYASPAEFASCFSAVLSAALKGVGSVDVPTVCRLFKPHKKMELHLLHVLNILVIFNILLTHTKF